MAVILSSFFLNYGDKKSELEQLAFELKETLKLVLQILKEESEEENATDKKG